MAKKHEVEPAPATKPEPKAEPVALYTIGKPYGVKVEHNTRTWERILALLANGPATITDIQKVCVYEHNGEVVDHKRFARYMIRTGHLRVAE